MNDMWCPHPSPPGLTRRPMLMDRVKGVPACASRATAWIAGSSPAMTIENIARTESHLSIRYSLLATRHSLSSFRFVCLFAQQKKGSGTPANALSNEPHQRVRHAPRIKSACADPSAVGRARLPAFHCGSCPREYFIPRAPIRARLPGTWRSAQSQDARPNRGAQTSRISYGLTPAPTCPSPGKHLPPWS